MMTEHIWVEIYSGDSYGGDKWPPTDLLEFGSWLAEQIGKVPPEYQGGATITIREDDWDNGRDRAACEIGYWRLETVVERQQREMAAESHAIEAAKAQEARERGMLAALKRKYE